MRGRFRTRLIRRSPLTSAAASPLASRPDDEVRAGLSPPVGERGSAPRPDARGNGDAAVLNLLDADRPDWAPLEGWLADPARARPKTFYLKPPDAQPSPGGVLARRS